MCNRVLFKAAISYAAGSLGALANAAIIVLFSVAGFELILGVSGLSAWSLDWLYPRLVWGGVLAFFFILPFYQNRWFIRGLVWSIVPTIPHFFIIFPGQSESMMATHLGLSAMGLLVAYLFNCVWGLVTSYSVHKLEEKS